MPEKPDPAMQAFTEANALALETGFGSVTLETRDGCTRFLHINLSFDLAKPGRVMQVIRAIRHAMQEA